MRKKMLALLLCGIMAASPAPVWASSKNVADQDQTVDSADNLLSGYTLDGLQSLYLSITPDMSYSDVVLLIEDSELPYSEEKYNGSRELQVAKNKDTVDISGDMTKEEQLVYYFEHCK